MRIAVDVDGVLADAIVVWVDVFNAEHHCSLRIDEIKGWDFFGTLNIDRKEFDRIFELAWKNWRAIPSCEEMLDQKVKEISKLGDVSIVTARSITSIPYVKAWLSERTIFYDEMVVVDYGPLKSSLDYDVFIDDSPLNATNIAHSGKTVLLYDQPWNQGIEGDRIVRVRGLVEAIAAITDLKQSS